MPEGSGETGINGRKEVKRNDWLLKVKPLLLPRILAEYDRVRNALQPLKSISSRSWPVERNRVYLLKERLMKEERDVFPIIEEIDIESYVLCAAAATRKYCVNEDTLNIIKIIYLFFLYIPVILIVMYIASHTSLLHA